MKELLFNLLYETAFTKKLLNTFLSHNTDVKINLLQTEYLKKQIYSYYNEESLKNKYFYNIGAGNQRSKFDFWSHIDLAISKYNKSGIDVFYDLESKEEIPLESNHAEVLFNSFVIEHITKEATKNLCREAYRILKDGGVFHSKIHCYDYGVKLMKRGLLSPKTPYHVRECKDKIKKIIKRNKGKVTSYFEDNNYIVQSTKNPEDKITFDPQLSFLYHNATATIEKFKMGSPRLCNLLDSHQEDNLDEFYSELKTHIDHEIKEPHQHNAEYFSKEELIDYLKEVGFSEVYFTQPYQSVSPALWEDVLNPIHFGFISSIEAVK